jgi:hypothetical protein
LTGITEFLYSDGLFILLKLEDHTFSAVHRFLLSFCWQLLSMPQSNSSNKNNQNTSLLQLEQQLKHEMLVESAHSLDFKPAYDLEVSVRLL